MKRQPIHLAFVILLVVSFIIPAEATVQPSFQGLGDLPGRGFSSQAYAVSADGLVIVGMSDSAVAIEAFRWENGRMVGLGNLSGGGFWSWASGVAADGSVVVGWSYLASGYQEAFRWEDGQMVGLDDLPGGRFLSEASGVSADGLVVVGHGDSGQGTAGIEAFRWEDDVMVGLGDLPGGDFHSSASGVSADGSVIVGWGGSAWGEEAFRWEDGVMVGLGDLPGGSFKSRAYAVSADGSVIVGWSHSASGYEAFRWEDGKMVGLGDLPRGDFWSWPYGVSADGSVIVGKGDSASGYEEAFIWDADNGMRNLKDVLVSDYALDLTGWYLRSARGISADGLTIVGVGRNPNGYTEGWIATIPEPGTIFLLVLGAVMLRRQRRGFGSFEFLVFNRLGAGNTKSEILNPKPILRPVGYGGQANTKSEFSNVQKPPNRC